MILKRFTLAQVSASIRFVNYCRFSSVSAREAEFIFDNRRIGEIVVLPARIRRLENRLAESLSRFGQPWQSTTAESIAMSTDSTRGASCRNPSLAALHGQRVPLSHWINTVWDYRRSRTAISDTGRIIGEIRPLISPRCTHIADAR